MSKLNDYKDEINKCSKCGLCQSVCPVYEFTGNDCSVSRGKFIMLNGIVKGDLNLNKNVNKYLDMCLKCNACKNFCPSGIDARKIFLAAKEEYFNKAPSSIFRKILNSAPVFNFFMYSINIATTVYRFLKFDKILKHFYALLKKFELGKKVILANEFLSSPKLKIQNSKHTTNPLNLKVVYFEGCVNEYINPRTSNAVNIILKQMGIDILKTKFNCCGVPFLSSGNVKQFIKQAECNLSQIPDDFDYFLTDCASCQSSFKDYENYIQDEKLLEKLQKINQKSINIVDFIVKNAKSFEFKEPISFTFHKPCHLDDLNFLAEFIKKTKNVKYIEMKDFDVCCGFSGEFALKNAEISEKISSQKAQNASATNADVVLTSCPACVLGLTQGFVSSGNLLAPLNFVEFLLQAEITT